MKRILSLLTIMMITIHFICIDVNAENSSVIMVSMAEEYLINGCGDFRYTRTKAKLNLLEITNDEEISDEIKFADKATTARYNLLVMNIMLARVNELLPRLSNSNDSDTDKESLLLEINSLIDHVNWIYDTNIFGDKLFSNQKNNSILVGFNEIILNLNPLNSTFPKKVEDGSKEVQESILKQMKIIADDLKIVATVIEELEKNNIFGHNHSDFIYEQAESLIKRVSDEEYQLSDVHEILQRQKELLVRLANHPFELNDFESIKKEYIQLNEEHQRIISSYLSDETWYLNNKETIINEIDDVFVGFTNKELTTDNINELNDELDKMITLISLHRAYLGAIHNTAECYSFDSDKRFIGNLTITKKTANNEDDCYIGIFDEKNNLINIFKVSLKYGSETFTINLPIFDDKIIYSIHETDEDGNELKESNLLLDRTEIIFTINRLHENVVITDRIVENPEMGVYSIFVIGMVIILTMILVYFYFRGYNRFSRL